MPTAVASALAIALSAGLAGAAAPAGVHANGSLQGEGVWIEGGVCLPDEQGHMYRYTHRVRLDEGAERIRESADPIPGVRRSADGDNRLDIVIVGDGYTASDMTQFHFDAMEIEEEFFRYEPLIAYRPYFRFTAVEVLSNESGVDNDPSQGISRDTALDMGYWCGGTERALCVNVSRARLFASQGAPFVDQVLAIANSEKYGGVGYPSQNLGTAAGQNSAAVEIAIHEMGHSLGDLADEYTYGGPETYTGGERPEANTSIYDALEMLNRDTKWADWIGVSDPRFDSPAGTYEGAHYSVFGVNRPSNNSAMRSLGRRFNGPSAQQLIRSIYREVSPIDACTPAPGSVNQDSVLSITPMQPVGHDLLITWQLNGADLPQAAGQTSLDLSTLGLVGANTITATVVDPTDMVRSESIRDQFLTDTATWSVVIACGLGDFNADGILNNTDINAFAASVILHEPAADLNGDGAINNTDINIFVAAFLAGCGA